MKRTHHGAVPMCRRRARRKRATRAGAGSVASLLDPPYLLPTQAPDLAPNETLPNVMRVDKKVADGQIRLILPDRLGAVSIVSDTPDQAINQAWNTLR